MHVCCDMPASSTPNSHTYPLLHMRPASYCPTPDPTLPIPAGPVAKKKKKQYQEEEAFSTPVGGSHCGSVSPTRALLFWVVVLGRPTLPPQWMEVFEMSPQTPDCGDVPLSDSCRGALMTDSIFVSAIAPRWRRWICSGASSTEPVTAMLCQKVSCCQKCLLLYLESLLYFLITCDSYLVWATPMRFAPKAGNNLHLCPRIP